MTENQIEPLAAELRCAIAELRKVEAERNTCLKRWAELRFQLQQSADARHNTAVRHKFEHEVVLLHELDARLEASKRRVRLADGRLGGEVQRWALANRMQPARSQAA